MTDETRVLLVEDDAVDAEWAKRALRRPGEGGSFVASWASTLEEALERVGEQEFDVILLDLSLPDCTGSETLRRMHEAAPDVALIVLTGLGDDEFGQNAVRHGAQDYLVKGETGLERGLLIRSIRYALERRQAERARQNAERQLQQAQRMEAIGQLAAGIAHEINTPIQYIGDNAHFLDESFASILPLLQVYPDVIADAKAGNPMTQTVEQLERLLEEADCDYLVREIPQSIKQTIEGVQSVARIVSAMKEFSHPGAARKEPVDLNHAIESTITVARNEWKHVAELVTELEPDLPPVHCHPGDFNQAVLNIVVNAAHAIGDMANGEAAPKGTIRVTTRCDGEWVEVRITDTGPGIPAELRSRIFEPFFTTKEVGRGTGQGLSIAYGAVVEKHGGSLSFETEEGKGTTFILRMPIRNEPDDRPA